MKIRRIKNSITYFLIVLFLSMKMAGLHALSHADDKEHAEHCAICDHAIVNNLTPILTPDFQCFTIETIEFIVHREVTSNYRFIIFNTISVSQLFSRPPPFLV